MKTSYFFTKTMAVAFLFMFALSFGTNAQQATIDGIVYQVTEEGYAETTHLPKDGDTHVPYTAETITIPAKVTIGGAEYPVKKIGNNSMRENPNLKSVSLPDGLEIIGNSSFAQCSELKEVAVPASVKSIEDWSFYACTKLEKINIPDGVTAITEHTFQQTGLTEIELPASVKSLKVCAFQDASKLASINLENITEIVGWALYGTAIESADIANVFSIGGEAFRKCPNLEKVTFENVTSIGGWSFEGCPKLTSIDFGTVETIEVGAFSGCSALASITIPSSVLFIDGWAFEKTGLTEVFASWEDPAGEAFIDDYAFGADEGRPNFTWKVPEAFKAAYGDEYLGFPVEVGEPNDSSNEHINGGRQANVYYANGILAVSDLEGYRASVYTLNGQVIAQFIINGNNCSKPLLLTPGIYIFNAVNGNSSAAAKFIVK
ncbi:MAG: leucine-rich repeat domain-containing protein [Tannerella sp.]|jgi:hypothetical protein|nr:leucine-rich repeat domain-containing protein [Tannerella sp.]